MMRRIKILAALVPLIFLSLACAKLTLKQPTASFKTMNVTDVTPQGFTMAFDMDVQNPNAATLPLSGSSYQLGVGGVKLLEGKAKPTGSLPANGSLPVTLPVTVTFDNLLAAEKSIVGGGGQVPYSFTGSLDVSTAAKLLGNSISVPLKYEGTLDVKKLVQDPQVLMQSPAAKKLAQQLIGSMFGR